MKFVPLLSLLNSVALIPVSASLQLNVTAISARDGSSTFECWRMEQPFHFPSEPDLYGSMGVGLGSVSNFSYTVAPSNFNTGLHNAPYNQWAIIVGLAYFTLPDPDDDATSVYVAGGGASSVMFAADTAEVSRLGHNTRFPGTAETIVIQIPTHDGEVPKHNVLHMGPCGIGDMTGIREAGLGGLRPDSIGPSHDGAAWIGNLFPMFSW